MTVVCKKCGGQLMVKEMVVYDIDKEGYGYDDKVVCRETTLHCKTTGCDYSPAFSIEADGQVVIEDD